MSMCLYFVRGMQTSLLMSQACWSIHDDILEALMMYVICMTMTFLLSGKEKCILQCAIPIVAFVALYTCRWYFVRQLLMNNINTAFWSTSIR